MVMPDALYNRGVVMGNRFARKNTVGSGECGSDWVTGR
jgi:hypothetical protein